MKFKLAIGDKIYSTWSLRPWLVLKYFNIPFDELKIKLRSKDAKKKILRISPSGKVPCLIYGKIKIYGQKITMIKYWQETFLQKCIVVLLI